MADGRIWIPRRKPGPRLVECATMRTSVRILGQAQIDTFRAMCALAGRRPHELAYDIVLEAIRAGQENHEVQELVQAIRRRQSDCGWSAAAQAHGLGDTRCCALRTVNPDLAL